MKRDRTRSIWRGMRARCSNPKHISYPSYGGAGVSVCARWDSYENFLADMGPAPPSLSIERLDRNQAYCPSNCMWATARQQARNRSNNVHIEFLGESLPIAAWAERYGFVVGTLWRRLNSGAPMDIAVSKPLLRGKPWHGYQRPRKERK